MSLIVKIKTKLIFHLLKKDIHSEFAKFLISSLMKQSVFNDYTTNNVNLNYVALYFLEKQSYNDFVSYLNYYFYKDEHIENDIDDGRISEVIFKLTDDFKNFVEQLELRDDISKLNLQKKEKQQLTDKLNKLSNNNDNNSLSTEQIEELKKNVNDVLTLENKLTAEHKLIKKLFDFHEAEFLSEYELNRLLSIQNDKERIKAIENKIYEMKDEVRKRLAELEP
jgi:hypothetical protein